MLPHLILPLSDEDEVGAAISKSGVARKDLWLTSKLWNSFHRPDHVEKVSEIRRLRGSRSQKVFGQKEKSEGGLYQA